MKYGETIDQLYMKDICSYKTWTKQSFLLDILQINVSKDPIYFGYMHANQLIR